MSSAQSDAEWAEDDKVKQEQYVAALESALAAETKRAQDAEAHAAALRATLERCVREATSPDRSGDEESWDHDIHKPYHFVQEALSASPASCGERGRKLEAVAEAARVARFRDERPWTHPSLVALVQALDALDRKE